VSLIGKPSFPALFFLKKRLFPAFSQNAALLKILWYTDSSVYSLDVQVLEMQQYDVKRPL